MIVSKQLSLSKQERLKMTDINTFVSQFKDFSRTNLFDLTFTGTPIGSMSKLLKYSVISATLPGVTFVQGEFITNGLKRKSVINHDYDPFNVVFRCDSEGKIIKFLDDWSKLIFNDGVYGYMDDYVASVTAILYDRAGIENSKIELNNIYPVNLSTFEMSYENSDEILTYSVDFSWESTK